MKKNIKKKLGLNKVTISKLNNLEMSHAYAGFCPPPVSDDQKFSCDAYFHCITVFGYIAKQDSTTPC